MSASCHPGKGIEYVSKDLALQEIEVDQDLILSFYAEPAGRIA
jgi:hypothetical protein